MKQCEETMANLNEAAKRGTSTRTKRIVKFGPEKRDACVQTMAMRETGALRE